ncbi:MAG: arsenic resistance N-acetyltransferase ArsN2 [Gemmatimonadaceae bacterium]
MTHGATSGVTVRRGSAHDITAVEDLLTKTKLPRLDVNDLIDSFIVAEDNGRVMGVAGVERHGEYGLLRSVAVDPAAQGRGVGRALVEHLIAESNEKGIAELYLLTTTAEKYFPVFGFAMISREATPVEIQETSEFTDLCPSTATVMRCVLKT